MGQGRLVILIILLPWLGVLIYLIARGSSMNERAIQDAQAADAADARLRAGRSRHAAATCRPS